jgi:hypothetical protein
MLQSAAEKLSAAINSAKPQDLDQSGQPVSGGGIRGEGDSTATDVPKDVFDLGDQVQSVKDALATLTGSFTDAAGRYDNQPSVTAARGGYVHDLALAGGGAIGPSPKETLTVIIP